MDPILDKSECYKFAAYVQESLKRQDILERSHKQQLATENRKHRGARQQLKTSEERAAKLEVELKVNFYNFNPSFLSF